jgi:hypothetical protein
MYHQEDIQVERMLAGHDELDLLLGSQASLAQMMMVQMKGRTLCVT